MIYIIVSTVKLRTPKQCFISHNCISYQQMFCIHWTHQLKLIGLIRIEIIDFRFYVLGKN